MSTDKRSRNVLFGSVLAGAIAIGVICWYRGRRRVSIPLAPLFAAPPQVRCLDRDYFYRHVRVLDTTTPARFAETAHRLITDRLATATPESVANYDAKLNLARKNFEHESSIRFLEEAIQSATVVVEERFRLGALRHEMQRIEKALLQTTLPANVRQDKETNLARHRELVAVAEASDEYGHQRSLEQQLFDLRDTSGIAALEQSIRAHQQRQNAVHGRDGKPFEARSADIVRAWVATLPGGEHMEVLESVTLDRSAQASLPPSAKGEFDVVVISRHPETGAIDVEFIFECKMAAADFRADLFRFHTTVSYCAGLVRGLDEAFFRAATLRLKNKTTNMQVTGQSFHKFRKPGPGNEIDYSHMGYITLPFGEENIIIPHGHRNSILEHALMCRNYTRESHAYLEEIYDWYITELCRGNDESQRKMMCSFLTQGMFWEVVEPETPGPSAAATN